MAVSGFAISLRHGERCYIPSGPLTLLRTNWKDVAGKSDEEEFDAAEIGLPDGSSMTLAYDEEHEIDGQSFTVDGPNRNNHDAKIVFIGKRLPVLRSELHIEPEEVRTHAGEAWQLLEGMYFNGLPVDQTREDALLQIRNLADEICEDTEGVYGHDQILETAIALKEHAWEGRIFSAIKSARHLDKLLINGPE